MTEVGVRELRNGLSRWLDRVRRGEEIIVTDRGMPVARIEPVDKRSGYDELVARGLITRATYRPKDRPLPTPVSSTGSVSEFVDDQRR